MIWSKVCQEKSVFVINYTSYLRLLSTKPELFYHRLHRSQGNTVQLFLYMQSNRRVFHQILLVCRSNSSLCFNLCHFRRRWHFCDVTWTHNQLFIILVANVMFFDINSVLICMSKQLSCLVVMIPKASWVIHHTPHTPSSSGPEQKQRTIVQTCFIFHLFPS
jgi:hypothetical protein